MKVIEYGNFGIIEEMFKAQKQKINKLRLPGWSTPITIFDFTDSQSKGNIASAAAAKAGIRPLRLQKNEGNNGCSS
jgi:hypothetical protein